MIHDTTDLQMFCLLKQEYIYTFHHHCTQISAHLSGQMKMMRIMKYCCQETQISGLKDCVAASFNGIWARLCKHILHKRAQNLRQTVLPLAVAEYFMHAKQGKNGNLCF